MKYQYSILIQNNQNSKSLYIRSLPLESSLHENALCVRGAESNSDCLFVLRYSLN